MQFAPSARSTIGIEWELGVVDPVSRDLAPRAASVIDGAADERIKGEFMTNTIELVSGVHSSIDEGIAEMRELRDTALLAAEREGLLLIGAGTHPFALWREQEITDAERYRRLIDRAASWGERLVIFGVHNHIGVEDREKVAPILRMLLDQLPLILAVSASSPFWQGHDTGFASERTMLFQQLPTGGLPPLFEDWAGYEFVAGDLLAAGILEELGELRWDVRPAPRYGTVEARIADGAASLDELAAISALTACLVEEASVAIDEDREPSHLPAWYLRENKWCAARYGLDAEVIVDAAGTRMTTAELLVEAANRLEPIAARLGGTRAIAAIEDVVRTGGSAERQRKDFAKGGSSLVVDGLVAALRS